MKCIVVSVLLFYVADLVMAQGGPRCGLPYSPKDMPFLNWRPSNRFSMLHGKARIVNGIEARPHSWPWQIGVGEKFSNGEHKWVDCCGSIVTSRVVITANHCVDKKKTHCVYLGAHSRKQHFTECINVDKVLNYTNDFAILTFNEPLPLNSRASPVCIPDHPIDDGLRAECYVTGWGQTELGKLSDVLRQTALNIQPHELCKKAYGADSVENMICAFGQSPVGNKSMISDSCGGDSGGPLVCRYHDGRFMLYGVVSGGPSDCASKKWPGVYVDVTKFRKEIDDAVASNGGWK